MWLNIEYHVYKNNNSVQQVISKLYCREYDQKTPNNPRDAWGQPHHGKSSESLNKKGKFDFINVTMVTKPNRIPYISVSRP